MTTRPDITVAIPSHGGNDRIVGLLESLCCQDAPPDAFNVLVVDNLSPIPLAGVVDRFQTRLRIRVIRENALGLSHARNRAIEELETAVVIFLDDDVVASPALVTTYRTAFGEQSLEAGAGPILPLLSSRPPFWFRGPILPLFALQDLGSAQSYGKRYPYGANFAVRRTAVRYPFDVRLGRKGRSLLSGEERRFFEQNAFERIAHLPEASVEHVIPEERLRLRWVTRRAIAQVGTRRALARIERNR